MNCTVMGQGGSIILVVQVGTACAVVGQEGQGEF